MWKLETQKYTDKEGKSTDDKPVEIVQQIVDNKEVQDLDDDFDTPIPELKVEKPKEEEKVEVVEDTTTPYFKTLSFLATEGILDLDDDDEFEDSKEGLVEAVQLHIKKEQEKFEANLPEEEKELLMFIKNGGTAKDFLETKNEIDYSDIDLEGDTEDVQRNKFNIVIDHLVSIGYEYEEAVDQAKSTLEAGNLDKQAKIAQKKLIEFSKKSNEQKIESLKAEKAKKLEEQAKQQEDYKKTVLSTRSLKGFEIKEKEAQNLYDFITKVDKQGVTPLQKVMTEENKLTFAWLLMNGFDLKKLEQKATTEVTQKIKQKLGAHRDVLVKPKVITKQEEEQGKSKLKIHWNLGK